MMHEGNEDNIAKGWPHAAAYLDHRILEIEAIREESKTQTGKGLQLDGC